MESRFRSAVTLVHNTNGAAPTLASARVCAGALTTDRETTEVAQSAVALDGLEALQVLRDIAAQVTFALVAHAYDVLDDLVKLFLRKILGPHRRIKA